MMKKRISIMLSLLCSLTVWAQIGGDYNPENPSDPGVPEIKHTLTLTASPADGGSFNIQKERFAEGSSNNLRAYTNTDFVFKGWSLNGVILSTEQELRYVMPQHDVNIVGLFEYNPANPSNPGSNFWDKEKGLVIVDDFKAGLIDNAISSAIRGSDNDDVTMITVAGRMNNNDFGIANNYSNCSLLDLSRVTGVTEIPSYAFDYTNLNSIYLPYTIEKIGSYAFADCKNLEMLMCYSMTPPTLESNAFANVPDGLIIYVPATAISQYLDADIWKDFILLPLQMDISNLQVNLPAGTNATDYTNMWLELVNKKNDQRMHYVMTNRDSYVFNNVIHNTLWDVVLRNQEGDVFGRINDVQMENEDVNVTFTSLSKPQNVTISVIDDTGRDVAPQTQVTWTDLQGNYISQGLTLNSLPVDKKLNYRIILPQELAMQYKMPSLTEYVVKNEENNLVYQLESIKQVTISGIVKDATTGIALSGATISVSQTYAGKYTKTVNVKTDNKGFYSLGVADVPTTISVAAADYISQTIDYDDLTVSNEVMNLPDVMLKAITGAVISVNFTYTESVEAGQTAETQNWFSDEANVTYSIVNQTKNKPITEFNVQNGSIVLLEEVAEGDILSITAISKTAMFKDVVAQTEIDSRNRADVTFPIVELGGLKATFSESENNGVVGILYDGNGVLKSKTLYNGETLTISNLADGSYTLVTMGNSKFFNSVLNLSELSNTGLTEGRDFVSNSISIASGVITALNIASVPTFDESQFYYTGENTSFSANKSQVTIGNYITLRAKIDFKDEYATSVRDLRLVVDLPESCSFVDNSVLAGNGMGGYEVAGKRVTVNMNSLDDVVRFCVIPIAGGTCKPSAFVHFNYGGEAIQQPIGSAYFNAQNLAISLPSQTADSVVVVNGTAQTDCVVKVYDGNVMIGQTRSLANGRWSARVNLYKPYSHSFHNIYAEVVTANGQSLLTDTKLVELDKTMTQLKTITMLYNGNTIVFDQIEGTTSTNTYSYVPSVHDFTFIAQFTKNDTALIKNLEFKVLASDGTVRRISSTYSSRYNAWVGKATYDNSSKIPANVSAEYTLLSTKSTDVIRASEELITILAKISSLYEGDTQDYFSIISKSDDSFLISYKDEEMTSPLFILSEVSDFNTLRDELSLLEFEKYEIDNINYCIADSIIDEGYIYYLWNTENQDIVKFTLSGNSLVVNIPNYNVHNNSQKRIAGIIIGAGISLLGKGDYFRDCHELDYWWQQYGKDASAWRSMHRRTIELLNAVCEDGSPRIHPSQKEFLLEYLNITDRYAQNLFERFQKRLEQYEKNLWWAWGRGVAGDAIFSFGAALFKEALGVTSWLKGIANVWAREATEGGVAVAEGLIGNGIANLFHIDSEREKMQAWYNLNMPKLTKDYLELQNLIIRSYGKCPKKEEDPEDEDPDYNTRPLKPSVDPSGYVYEGVSSNRLQGVTATAYYMETTEDMYGVLHDEPKVWDAEEYAQENPLFTDENGMYQWDVPQGLWQVKFEKEGYETTYSEWLPVPPPQLEVNIGMVQSRQPEVKTAHAYTDGVEVEFDKYMLPELLNTNNIMVSQNGTYVDGTIKLMNEEKAYTDEDVTYASKVRFVPSTPFSAHEVTLYVNNRVKSYANVPMADNYSQTFDIEKEVKELVVDEITNVPYTGKKDVSVYVLPADAAAGKKMRASSAAELIASLEKDEVVIDENGLAQFTLNGELPGATGISFSIEDVDVSATTMAKVEMEQETTPTYVPMPNASIAAGSSVYRNTEVELTADDNLKIWYTTDGSCPCDENGSRQIYSAPIVITGDMVIKAMAETSEGDGSDVATFTYSILRNNDGVTLNNGWTWTSFNMASEALADVNTALASGTWTTNDEIKNDRYTDSYSVNQRKWIGTLSKHGKLDNAGMFKIHSSQAQTLRLTGEAINLQTVSITVNPNWNYIGYLPMNNMSVTEALIGYDAKEGDVIKSQDAFAVYSANNGWQGDLTTMHVGQGYMLKRNANAATTSFKYPNGSIGTRAKVRRTETHPYANNMNVIGQVIDVDTENGDSLIAMVNGDVRGASMIQKSGKVFLTIQGDETENVELVLQRDGEQIAVANAPIRYANNDILGTLDVPTDIKFASANQDKEGIKVSPCIVETSMTVLVNRTDAKDVSVMINSTNGALITEVHQNGIADGRFEQTFNLSNMPAGVYLVTIHINGKSNVIRILKK